ncbi:hypothetical protein NQ317_001078 [Molorchus minor]|uniref:Uncharacterized protein n=1 Tax=Molorchus minor TaxID=1323400 RepID=A0ABQ9JNW0_9CUCU|nr:hypothetical protein NQ317_001078 [Molorchus minor]
MRRWFGKTLELSRCGKIKKYLLRKRASEVKLAEKRTGNFTFPHLFWKKKKILSIIGVESSTGLGFHEGFMGEEENIIEQFVELETLSDIDQDGRKSDHTYNTIRPAPVPSTSTDTEKTKTKKGVKASMESIKKIAEALNKIGWYNTQVCNCLCSTKTCRYSRCYFVIYYLDYVSYNSDLFSNIYIYQESVYFELFLIVILIG